MDPNLEKQATHILSTAMKVITNPAAFFREMPKNGGFSDPLIFAVAVGVAAGVLRAIFGIVGLGVTLSFWMAIASIILVPVMIAIFGFVGAAIGFIIWKAMGSQESYETAYRCCAYAMAISPITTLLDIIPYLGGILGVVWMFYLLLTASTEVHRIEQKKALIVFGVICVLMVISSTCSQYTTRKMQSSVSELQEKMKNMTPEEAGKSVGEFLKGLEKGSGQSE